MAQMRRVSRRRNTQVTTGSPGYRDTSKRYVRGASPLYLDVESGRFHRYDGTCHDECEVKDREGDK